VQFNEETGKRSQILAHYPATLCARVAKLADAPDLGFRNYRFQNIALRFKKQSFYERKTATFGEIMQFANGE